MLILNWNCQGLGRPLTVQILRGLISTHRPKVVFLVETKNKASFLDRLHRRFHFPYKCYVDPLGISGGLALWCTDDIHLNVRMSPRNMIHSIISSPACQSSWAATFVYAPPQRLLRKNFWIKFRQMAHENSYPWLCIGDLNEISCLEEKLGGAECCMSQLQAFMELLSDCALMDLEFKGPPFTWSNNQ